MRLSKKAVKLINVKIASDFVYTFVALLMVNIVLQLIIYPLINRFYSSEFLGDVVYYSGIIYTLSASAGSAIAAQKLLLRERFQKNNSDFNIVVFSVSSIIFVFLCVLSLFLGNGFLSSFLYGIAGALVFLRYYSEVEFRLTKNFKGYFYYYLFVSFGYLVGFLAFLLSGQWSLIFIIGEALAVGYVMIKGGIYQKEPLTGKLSEIFKLIAILTFSYLLGSLGAHYYKILIKLLLGGDAVTVYYVSSFFGKSLDLVITPISTLMLSYLTASGNNKFYLSSKRIALLSILISAVLFVILTVATPIYCRFLYPNIFNQVSNINITVNIAQSISVVSSVLFVFVLIKQGTKTHLIIQLSSVLTYIACTTVLTYFFGLAGFAIGAIIGFSCKYILILGIPSISLHFRIKKGTEENVQI